MPDSVRMKQLIDEGKLGEIYYVICEYLQDIRQQGGDPCSTKPISAWAMA